MAALTPHRWSRESKAQQSTFHEILERLSGEHERQLRLLQMEVSQLRNQLGTLEPKTVNAGQATSNDAPEVHIETLFAPSKNRKDKRSLHVPDVMAQWAEKQKVLQAREGEHAENVMQERAAGPSKAKPDEPEADGPPPVPVHASQGQGLWLTIDTAPGPDRCSSKAFSLANVEEVCATHFDRDLPTTRQSSELVPLVSNSIIESQHAFRNAELHIKAKFDESCKESDETGILRSCFQIWLLLTRHMRTHFAFQVSEPWKGDGPSRLALHRPMQVGSIQEEVDIVQDDIVEAETAPRVQGWGRLILAPNATLRTWWDLVGTVLLLYDIVGIPLGAFSPDDNVFTTFMDHATLAFWTLDIVMSCITGYVHKGVTVMEPKLIFTNYLKTLFIMDLVVVGPDWVTQLMLATASHDQELDTNSDSSVSRLVRVMRVARLARLLRLLKLARGLAMLRDRIESEVMFIVANIMKLIVMLLIVNHFLGSLWYLVGGLCKNAGMANWIEEYFADDFSLGYRYFTSLHWSLTQFTPASMDVQPNNTYERMFAICCLVFGLVLFSSFISSITASMTQLRNMSEDKSKQFWLLRRYLRQRGIDKQLTFRILRYVEYAIKEKTVLVSESKVWSLALLSQQLREELQYEVSFKCLMSHPFFERARSVSSISTFKLAEQALSVEMLASKDTLFNPGTAASQMYIVGSGQLKYLKMDELYLDEGDDCQKLTKDDWACEHALWTKWTHLGCLRAISEVRLVAIAVKAFEDVIKMDPVAWELAHGYAAKYVQWLNETPRGTLSDVAHQLHTASHVRSFLVTDRLSGPTAGKSRSSSI